MSESDFLIYSRERARFKQIPADKVEIALSDETGFTRQGTLDFVDNVLNRSSGTIHARATVPNPDHLLTSGEFARVRLIVGAPVQALLVPDTAVLPDQSQHSVMTVAPDGTVVPKQVAIGDLRGSLRVILSGLTRNDRVIIDGIPHASPGAKVAPQDGSIRYAAGEGQG
jgi:membrane fusion protein, multidrug efflux system